MNKQRGYTDMVDIVTFAIIAVIVSVVMFVAIHASVQSAVGKPHLAERVVPVTAACASIRDGETTTECGFVFDYRGEDLDPEQVQFVKLLLPGEEYPPEEEQENAE